MCAVCDKLNSPNTCIKIAADMSGHVALCRSETGEALLRAYYMNAEYPHLMEMIIGYCPYCGEKLDWRKSIDYKRASN